MVSAVLLVLIFLGSPIAILAANVSLSSAKPLFVFRHTVLIKFPNVTYNYSIDANGTVGTIYNGPPLGSGNFLPVDLARYQSYVAQTYANFSWWAGNAPENASVYKAFHGRDITYGVHLGFVPEDQHFDYGIMLDFITSAELVNWVTWLAGNSTYQKYIATNALMHIETQTVEYYPKYYPNGAAVHSFLWPCNSSHHNQTYSNCMDAWVKFLLTLTTTYPVWLTSPAQFNNIFPSHMHQSVHLQLSDSILNPGQAPQPFFVGQWFFDKGKILPNWKLKYNHTCQLPQLHCYDGTTNSYDFMLPAGFAGFGLADPDATTYNWIEFYIENIRIKNPAQVKLLSSTPLKGAPGGPSPVHAKKK